MQPQSHLEAVPKQCDLGDIKLLYQTSRGTGKDASSQVVGVPSLSSDAKSQRTRKVRPSHNKSRLQLMRVVPYIVIGWTANRYLR